MRAQLEFVEVEVGRREKQLEDIGACAEKQQVKIAQQEKNLLDARWEWDDAMWLWQETEATLETT